MPPVGGLIRIDLAHPPGGSSLLLSEVKNMPVANQNHIRQRADIWLGEKFSDQFGTNSGRLSMGNGNAGFHVSTLS
jgi:hypothetical protein